MSKSDQFREYAKEALGWALRSKTEKEREALIYLAQTWTGAIDPAMVTPPGADPRRFHSDRARPRTQIALGSLSKSKKAEIKL
jgi:hypothetical protein